MFNYTPLVISGEWQKYAANIIKPTQTGSNREKFFASYIIGAPKKTFKASRVLYLGLELTSNHPWLKKQNPFRETKGKYKDSFSFLSDPLWLSGGGGGGDGAVGGGGAVLCTACGWQFLQPEKLQ